MNDSIIARPGQTLEKHIKEVFKIALNRFNLLNFNLSPLLYGLAKLSLEIITLTHDLGKATKYFQNWINQDIKENSKDRTLKPHSLFSSLFTIAIFHSIREFLRNDLRKKFLGNANYMDLYTHFGYLSQLIVRSHHGSLKDLSIICNQDMEGEILENHKKRLKSSDMKLINSFLKNLIFPILFKNVIIRKIQTKKAKQIFESLTTKTIETINSILNEKKFRFLTIYKNLFSNKGKIPGSNKLISFQIFILGKILKSIVIESDKMNSTIGMGFSISNNLITPKFNDLLRNFLIQKKFLFENEDFKENFNSLNQRRRFILDQVEKVNEDSINKPSLISFLSVPTGFGKTYSGLLFASKIKSTRSLKENNNFFQVSPRIIYALPFLSIIEQTEGVIKEFLDIEPQDNGEIDSGVFLVHHHLTEPKFETENDDEYDELTAELFIKSWNSQYILSTFNQLLNAIFKSDKNSALKFSKIINTTWILDEVQSIPLKYWKTLEEFLLIINLTFNVNLILMSATLPKIIDREELEDSKTFDNLKFNTLNIISNREIKRLMIGINRINLEYHGNISFTSFLTKIEAQVNNYIRKNKNLLVVLNTRKSAQKVYKHLKKFKNLKN
ncbi:MAG: CRISPR-associated endonuclease Cas3'' [Candidatus Lokiarchaeota archaeon]|nr:CRISPR-associated endonuclease Cas3'' [Candidatus Lokiarchaeota archaeon]